MRRPMKICGLLLWAATTVFGLSMSLNCTNFTDRETLLEPYRRCNVTVEHGYLHALCNISFGLQVHENLIRLEPETITVERHLVSDEPVDENTPEGGIICLSLHSITLRKWSNFPPVIGQQNDYSLTVNYTQSGLFHFNYLLVQIRQLTYKATFGEPAQAAIAICNGTRADRICKFDVYGFVEHNTRNSTDPEFQLDNVMRMLFMNWNIGSLTYEVMNITFRQSVKHIPLYLSLPLSMTPIRHIVFYKCNFHNITSREIPSFPNLERLEFFQTPIEEIHAVAFFRNPGLRHASFIGTKLSGIPEGIFNLTRLVTLDISDTDVPRNIKFEFCPLSCECNSTAQLLVMSRSRLDSLPDQAFCGFPLLKQLELENCHITNISGSPFECLENLSNLSLSDNKIRSLSGEAMKGLKNLSFLNLSKNRIVRFEGPRIFSTLPSLRMLILSQNEVKELELEVVKYVPIEELNLEHNQISKWKPPVFTNMRKLKTLHLEHNLLSRISDDMLSDISHVSYVNLGYNSWDCSSCQHKNLLSVLEKHPAYCSDCFVCKEQDDHEERLVVDVPWNMTACTPPDPYIVYGVPALLSILCASLIAYAVHRYRWYCMYGLLYLKVSVKGFRRHKQAGNFLWDGFLSYHASDAEWVRDVLVPKLESAPMNFRLCVSERDFIPGLPITENICRAITQSRVSLFVLSKEFCRSRWCMFELSLAQHRLFENDRHDGMVFIRKNDLEEYEMSPMMKYLMKTRTYVQLPPDGSSEALNNLFWLQVQAALQQ